MPATGRIERPGHPNTGVLCWDHLKLAASNLIGRSASFSVRGVDCL